MENLKHYAELLEQAKINYSHSKDVVRPNDCNIYGLALELAVKDYYGMELTIARPRENDIRYTDIDGRHFMEVKSNSSPISGCIGRSSKMAYVFGVQLDKPLSKQWGYVMPMKQFIAIGETLGHFKKGTTAGGRSKVDMKTQTVWNNSKGEPHGAKAYKLEDAYIEGGAVSFSEWFTERA